MAEVGRINLAPLINSAVDNQDPTHIKSIYESNDDTNVFTDSEKSKLGNIEINATADQTAEEILALLKTVDGTSSGLDADMLGGNSSSYYAIAVDVQTALDAKLDDSQLDTNTALGTSDTAIPSQKAVKTYIDNAISTKDDAIEIVYNNQDSNLSATNVKVAIDEITNKINTGEW